jgi:hypothetical protein
MISSILNSMSVKKLSARLSVLLVVCAFAVSAKAMSAQPTLINGEWGFVINLEDGDDLKGTEPKVSFVTDFTGNTEDWVSGVYQEAGNTGKLILRYYQGSAKGNIYVDQITTLRIITSGDAKIKEPEMEAIAGSNYGALTYLDLENATVENSDNTASALNPLCKLASKENLNTLIFPNTDGLFIPSQSFSNSHLETVIFPDSKGTYSMGAAAFGTYRGSSNTYLKRVQLGSGFTLLDNSRNPLTIDATNHISAGQTVYVFANCTNLKTLVLDNSITQLGSSMFENCSSLDYVVLPANLIHLGAFCFKSTGLKTFTFPDHIQLFDGAQVLQYCKDLTDVYVDGEYVKMGYQALLEENQTNNFAYNGGSNYSSLDYSPINSDYEGYHLPVLHYPGTETSRQNYRRPRYFRYNRVDPETGTTWPDAVDWSEIQNPTDGFDRQEAQNSDYGGWHQFYLGAQTIKEQDVFVDKRIKRSLWYSVVFPMDLTDSQFYTAYGLRADLNEFSGAVFDEENNKITLEFKEAVQADPTTHILVRKNVPYMIHPGDINLTTKKIIERYRDENNELKARYRTTGQTDENGYPIYETEQGVSFYNVQSDLFLKWDDQDDVTKQKTVMANAETDLFANKKPRRLVKRDMSTPDSSTGKPYTDTDVDDARVQYTFIGSYRQGQKIPAGSYYWGGRSAEEAAEQGISGNGAVVPFKFYYSKSGTQTWVPYGAVIMTSAKGVDIDKPYNVVSTTEPVTGNAKSLDADMSLMFLEEPNTTTALDKPAIEIPVARVGSKVYNMNGQLVRDNARGLNGLSKGMYIVNGRKVVIK